jgi:hypothetical protein
MLASDLVCRCLVQEKPHLSSRCGLQALVSLLFLCVLVISHLPNGELASILLKISKTKKWKEPLPSSYLEIL